MKYLSAAVLIPLLLVTSGCKQEARISTASPDALRSYDEGVDLFEKFYYTEAKTSFDRALSLDSAFAMAWARLALLNLHAKNQPMAKVDINTAVRFSHRATEREQLFIRMWYHFIHYAMNEATDVSDSLVKFYPEDSEGIVFRGRLYELDKNLEAAIAAYQQASSVDTSYAPAAMSLGYAYSTAGEQAKAIAQMGRYIRLAPDAADPRASYADLLLRVGRYGEALEQYKKSLELKQDYWYSFKQIGHVYETLGRLNDAEREYERAYSLLPPNDQLQASHMATDADLDVQRGKYEEAVRLYLKALSVDSTNGNAAFGLVSALIKLKKFQEAEQTIARIHEELQKRNLTRSEAMLSYHLMKANLFVERNLLDDALVQSDSALDYSSPLSRTTVYRHIAEIRLRQRSFEQALDACEDALRMNPNSPLGLLTLAKVYDAQGDRRMTREIGGRLFRLWEHADPEFLYLAELKRVLGIPV